MATIRQNAFARTTNQQSRDGTGLDDWALRRQQRQRYDHNVDAEMRKKNHFFDLYRQRHNTMKEQGCVDTTYTDNGGNKAREDWRWRALKKAICSFLEKRFVSL
jgi:hypothetical protein